MSREANKPGKRPLGDAPVVSTVPMPFRLPILPSFRWRRNSLPKPFGADLRGLGPVHVCSCGSQVFNALVSFEDFDIIWWFLDATCANCGNLVTIPCPADKDATQDHRD